MIEIIEQIKKKHPYLDPTAMEIFEHYAKEYDRELEFILKVERAKAVEEYKEEQAKSILEKGNPDWLGFDTPDRKLSKKYDELLEGGKSDGLDTPKDTNLGDEDENR